MIPLLILKHPFIQENVSLGIGIMQMVVPIGAFVACFASPYIAGRLNHIKATYLTILLNFIASALTLVDSYWVIVLGRLIGGFAVG